MIEYFKNNCAISGSDFESLVSFCKDISSHTRRRIIDFRGSKIFHYYSVNKNIDVMNLMCFDSSLINGIYRIDKRTGLYSLMGSEQIKLDLFRNSNTMFLIDEMADGSKARTFFEISSCGKKEYLFLGATCNKTFTSRMPALSFDSSIGRDLYLAEILNTNLELGSSFNSDGSRSNMLGVCSVRERFIETKNLTIAKAVAFFHKDGEQQECDTFDCFISLVEDMLIAHGGADVVGHWSFDNKILKVTLAFNDEVNKYLDSDIVPCHTFYMSDTGYVKSKIVPSWAMGNNIIEIAKDEKKFSVTSGIPNYQLALEESYVAHMKEFKKYEKDIPIDFDESDYDTYISELISSTGMNSSVTGIRKPQLDEFKQNFKQAIASNNVPKTSIELKKLLINALLDTKTSSETSIKRIQEIYLGKILF